MQPFHPSRHYHERTIPRERVARSWLSNIASLQAKTGDIPGAVTWVRKLDSPTARAFGLIGIIDGLAAATGKPAQAAGQSKSADHRRVTGRRSTGQINGWSSP